MSTQPLRPGLRHHISPDGGVILNLIANDGRSLSVSLTENHARDDAWSLLTAIDPDGACASDPVRALASVTSAMTPTDAKLLLALEAGHATAGALCKASGHPSRALAARMLDLRLKGWAVRVDAGHGRGVRATYSITAEGRRALAQLRETALS